MSAAFDYGAHTVAFWNDYLAALPAAPCDDLRRKRYVTGHFPPALAADAQAAIRAAPEFPYNEKADRAAWSALPELALARLAAGHSYRTLDARTRWHLWDALALLRAPVAEALGAPWRLLQVRSWISRAQAEGGPYELHSDGEPPAMLKVMIYWTPPGGPCGGLEVDIGGGLTGVIEGPAGTWVLFWNSALMHRAVAPQPGRERVVTELTLCAWPTFDLRPRTLGANARHPMFPLANERDEL